MARKGAIDRAKGVEKEQVIRYWSTEQIKVAINEGKYVEATAHAQALVERVLMDCIVSQAPTEDTRMRRRQKLDAWIDEEKPHPLLNLHALIELAWFLEGIDEKERTDLDQFRRIRNKIMHKHGAWYPGVISEEIIKTTICRAIHFVKKRNQTL